MHVRACVGAVAVRPPVDLVPPPWALRSNTGFIPRRLSDVMLNLVLNVLVLTLLTLWVWDPLPLPASLLALRGSGLVFGSRGEIRTVIEVYEFALLLIASSMHVRVTQKARVRGSDWGSRVVG